MSGEVVTWAFKQKTGSPAAKLVLVKLAESSNSGGVCWPSIEAIAEDAECGISTVYKHLRTLTEMGLAKPFSGVHPEKGYPLEMFQLFIPGWDVIPPGRKPRRSKILPGGEESPPGREGILRGGQDIPPGGMHIEEPSLEPPIEPSPEPSGTAVAVMGGASEIDLAVEVFNQAAETCPKWTRCRDVTHARRAAIAARLKTHGLDGWRRAVALAAASGHLGGPVPATGSHQGWRMDISWFAKAEHFSKIIEGTYAPARGATNGREAAREGIMDFFQNQAGSGIDRP